jgi:hypothetical protein
MKVTSVRNCNLEEIVFGRDIYYRENNGNWYRFNMKSIIDAECIKELEAAYQKFMNPPFKVIIAKYIKDEIAVRFQIGDDIFYLRASDRSLAKQSEQLEQALNSLMEGK